MPASKDPRSYVRPVPLPIPSSKGVKLLARDVINFNPENPTREEVRKNNYNRRLNQMSAMGFRSASHKPYMGIGDPFYLDEKKMILHALGQWTEEHASSSSSSDESDDGSDKKDAGPKPAFTAAKFVLRRSRKDLNTLNKAVVHGRNMIRNVSLGHGLFDLINKEKQHKKEASEAAIKRRRELLRNEFQPPKNESDDDTDEDLENDVDLTNYMVPVAPPTFLTQMQMDTDEELGIVNDNGSESDQSPEREPEIITFTGMALEEDEEEYRRARSAMVTSQMTSSYSRPVSRRKKKQETPRPYTPQHTNLSANISVRESMADSEQDVDISRDALFRQLCVLHWILEAMSTDPPSPMTPIMSCWSLSDIGGSRAQPKKLQRDKATESGWTSFLSKDTTRVSKRLSSQRVGSRSPHVRRPVHATGRNSVQSSATGSQQGSTTEGGPTPLGIFGKMASMIRSKNKEDSQPPSTSPVSNKLASLLKPKINSDAAKSTEPSEEVPLADPKLASLLKPKLTVEPSPKPNPFAKMSSLMKSQSTEVKDKSGDITPQSQNVQTEPDAKSPKKITDAKSSDAKSPPKIADAKTSDAKSPPKTADAKTSDAISPPKTADAKTSDAKSPQKTADAKTSDAKSPQKTADAKTPPKSKFSALLKPKTAEEQKSVSPLTPPSSPLKTGKEGDPQNASTKQNMEKNAGSKNTPKITSALFKPKKVEKNKSESSTPPSSPSKAGKHANSPNTSTSKQTPEKNTGPQNTPKISVPFAPKLSLKTNPLQGAASSLGQFLELKMKGGLNQLSTQMTMLGTRNDDLSPRMEDDEDHMYNKSIFKFLDEYYESLKTEEEAKKKTETENKSPSSTPPTTPIPERKNKQKKDKNSKKMKKEDSEKRLDHKVAVALGEEEKMTSKYLRANAHLIRPKSSAALMDFQAGLPSSKKATLCGDLHNQFAESREEKALTLHDILDHKESQRMSVCQSKFVSLQGMRHGCSFHRAVEDMRTRSWQQLRKPVNDRKKSTYKGNWYTDLVEKIPPELKQEWFYAKILQKLGNFGLPYQRSGGSFEKALRLERKDTHLLPHVLANMSRSDKVEGTGKQSIYKFIKVLEGLREWEICSPDITASVEFCRERIVEMTIEEYESWFTQRFPKVTRPQTAPPATKTEKKSAGPSSTTDTSRKLVPKRPSQSAFTRRAQH